MRLTNFIISSWVTTSLVLCSGAIAGGHLEQRQDNTASAFPTLGSDNSQSASATVTSAPASSNTQSSQSVTSSGFISASGSGSSTVSATHSTNNTSSLPPTSLSSSILPTSTLPTIANATSSAATNTSVLPIAPRITPALSIGGVILILTGIVYGLIGVKNRWVHIFLSTAYLCSLSITVLIVYVLNPPVSNAIQGAYFVGIFVTGIIFGAGALIFKEVTEGLGCLLGGFCLSMWFLTLKEGGLIRSTGGKAIFISAFCVVSWSLSFSHYTRAYGLMGSIAFSGATAFVLGIDCFSRGGLKEFWLFIWGLNDNIFPLNTNTYPISRGTRVETIVIILACIVGVISQIKLWKIVKDRQSQKHAAQEEETKRREAVEAALGRHLERQNDRDRSQWERQYGDRLSAKRETILWTEAHGEKGYSKIKETELGTSQKSSSTESLEMTNISKKPRSMYVSRVKRRSMPVTSIPEVEENDASNRVQIRQKVLDELEGNASNVEFRPGSSRGSTPAASPRLDGGKVNGTAATSVEDIHQERSPVLSNYTDGALLSSHTVDAQQSSDFQRYLSAPEEQKKKKRRSFTSFLSRSAKEDDDHPSITQSQEALVIPESNLRNSRASSLAATFDFENEHLEFPTIDTDMGDFQNTPEIVISPVDPANRSKATQSRASVRDIPPLEPELAEEHSDLDPEEFVRPAAAEENQYSEEARRMSSGPSSATKRQSGSEVGTDVLFEDAPKSHTATSETSQSEILTKGALELMPTHLSHVVMSYRTNEWAKHISAAEAPLFEEPGPIEEGEEIEVPTHLADPTTPAESNRSSLNHPLPSEVQAPIPSALPSSTLGIRINPAIQPEQSIISAVVKPMPVSRVRSTSDGSKVSRGHRSTSTPMYDKQALQTTPIDENAVVDFAPRQQNRRSASAQTMDRPTTAPSPSMGRPSTTLSTYPGVQRSNSRLSLVSENGLLPARAYSQMSNYQPDNAYPQGPYQHNPQQQGTFQRTPSRTETRLQHYDSHQPTRRNTGTNNQRRETMLADWRVSQSKSPDQRDHAEMRRQQMLMERQQVKIQEEQEKNYRMQAEQATDVRMRGRDMQELHREAMRRMQAGVNKKMTN